MQIPALNLVLECSLILLLMVKELAQSVVSTTDTAYRRDSTELPFFLLEVS